MSNLPIIDLIDAYPNQNIQRIHKAVLKISESNTNYEISLDLFPSLGNKPITSPIKLNKLAHNSISNKIANVQANGNVSCSLVNLNDVILEILESIEVEIKSFCNISYNAPLQYLNLGTLKKKYPNIKHA